MARVFRSAYWTVLHFHILSHIDGLIYGYGGWNTDEEGSALSCGMCWGLQETQGAYRLTLHQLFRLWLSMGSARVLCYWAESWRCGTQLDGLIEHFRQL